MSNPQSELVEFLAQFTHDPLGFVYSCFPWGKDELANYKGPDAWQIEILEKLGKGLINIEEAIRLAVASGHGIGKLHTYVLEIDTPNGRKRWGDLKVGDYVFGADGKPVKIIAEHHYKQVPMYRVTFDDDSYCDVSSGHLWNVKNRNDRRTGKGWRTLSTLEIVEAGVLRKSGYKPNGEQNWAKQWEIPIQGAAEFPHKETPLHPYLLGVWLGDGSREQPTYTKPYPEIRNKLKTLGYSVKLCKDDKLNYIKGIKHLLVDKVFSCRSFKRYIPDEYKYNDVASRKELLCGLLDTDGEINKKSSILYSTTSKQLAEDVLWLVRSLGGKAQLQPTDKQGWYYDDNRNRVNCRFCYRITMTLPFNPFSIKHRKERYKPNIEDRYRKRFIASIEPIGNADGMCITVDRPDGLYLANDFIVTHNSCLVSWIILWAVSTHEDTRGIVTANTETQLRSKTWPEVSKWYRMFIGRELFEITATAIFSADKEHEKTWRIDAIPWSKENPEAFAGLHNQGKRILVIFDEASAIIDEIWEVTEGAMTDAHTEIIWCAFGNPTRNTGRFYECFHSKHRTWDTKQIDSRTVAISNKKVLNQWVAEYGEDSDFVKVRVRGLFPDAAANQLIPRGVVQEARERRPEKKQYSFSPVIIGVDPAWTGQDMLAIVMRQGIYSHVLKTVTKNDNDLAVARMIAGFQDQYGASAVFIDMGYGTGIYSAGKDMGRDNWRIVQFGGKSDKEEYVNKRAEMWFAMKEWLVNGGCIDNEALADELVAPEAFVNRYGKHQLESKDDMKRRGVQSPNMADALALTFAFPVQSGWSNKYKKYRKAGKIAKWDAL